MLRSHCHPSLPSCTCSLGLLQRDSDRGPGSAHRSVVSYRRVLKSQLTSATFLFFMCVWLLPLICLVLSTDRYPCCIRSKRIGNPPISPLHGVNSPSKQVSSNICLWLRAFKCCFSCVLTPCEATNSWTWSTAWVEVSRSTQKSWSSGKARLGWTSVKCMARLKRYICRIDIPLKLCNSFLLYSVLIFVFKEHRRLLPSRFCECFSNLFPDNLWRNTLSRLSSQNLPETRIAGRRCALIFL